MSDQHEQLDPFDFLANQDAGDVTLCGHKLERVFTASTTTIRVCSDCFDALGERVEDQVA